MRRLCIIISAFVLFLTGTAYPSPVSTFAEKNPDVQKYEYARSFLAAMGYIKAVQERWHQSSPKKEYSPTDDVTMMHGYLAFLIKENADLRIAKNFLSPYLESPNELIRKSADVFILGCIRVIGINEKEKQIWDQWNAVKQSGYGSRKNETAFLNAQEELALKRKDAFKNMIEASILLTKVLRSSRNKDEKGLLLAISAEERKKLRARLDEIDKVNLDWGLKPGQDFKTACVAVIREILEDPIYKTMTK